MNEDYILLSKSISLMRFPLMLGVVLIPGKVAEPEQMIGQGFEIANMFTDICSGHITIACVPLFFIISGYLFFLKTGNTFDINIYFNSLKKRISTLLVPYIIWNIIVIIAFAGMHLLFPQYINPDNNNVCLFSIEEFIRSFWDYPGGKPICFQFWFLRDLMIAMAISPIVFLYSKYFGYAGLLCLMLLYSLGIQLFPYQIALTFFTIGAVISIKNINVVRIVQLINMPCALIYVICVICSQINISGLRGLETITAIIVYLQFFLWMTKNDVRISEFLCKSSFFIYAFHGLPIIIISRSVVDVINPSSNFIWMLSYILLFILILVLCLSTFSVIRILLPRTTAIITGGR